MDARLGADSLLVHRGMSVDRVLDFKQALLLVDGGVLHDVFCRPMARSYNCLSPQDRQKSRLQVAYAAGIVQFLLPSD